MANLTAADIMRDMEARKYLQASRHSRDIKSAAIMSVLSDAQEQIAHGSTVATIESINVAKLIAIDEDLAEFAAALAITENLADAAASLECSN